MSWEYGMFHNAKMSTEQVKRYGPSAGAPAIWTARTSDGDWVKYSDYLTLLAERARLAAENEELVAFAEKVVNWYENAGNSDPDQKSAGSVELWQTARSILSKVKP